MAPTHVLMFVHLCPQASAFQGICIIARPVHCSLPVSLHARRISARCDFICECRFSRNRMECGQAVHDKHHVPLSFAKLVQPIMLRWILGFACALWPMLGRDGANRCVVVWLCVWHGMLWHNCVCVQAHAHASISVYAIAAYI